MRNDSNRQLRRGRDDDRFESERWGQERRDRNPGGYDQDFHDRYGMQTGGRDEGRGYGRDAQDRAWDMNAYDDHGYQRSGRRDEDRGFVQSGSRDDRYGEGRSYDQGRRFDPGYGQDRGYGQQDRGYGQGSYGQGSYGQDRSYGQGSRGASDARWDESRTSWGERGMGGHQGKGPKGFTRDDKGLRDRVCEALADDDSIDPSGFEVRCEKGEITLEGTVSSRGDKRRAEQIAERVRGVDDVHNHLKVSRDRDSDTSTNGASRGKGTPTSPGLPQA